MPSRPRPMCRFRTPAESASTPCRRPESDAETGQSRELEVISDGVRYRRISVTEAAVAGHAQRRWLGGDGRPGAGWLGGEGGERAATGHGPGPGPDGAGPGPATAR